MTASNSLPIESKSTRPAWLSGCLTVLAILFLIPATLNLVTGSILAYIFLSAGIISPPAITFLLIIALGCIIYFLLAFRLKRQHWLISVALLALVWLVLPLPLPSLINTATMRVRNDGFAMMPTLPNGVYMIADRQIYQRQLPYRGDVILFQDSASSGSDRMQLKRVIGLPGEVVTIADGQVSIDGTPLDEPYISAPPPYKGEWKLGDRQYFVLGDNRPDSRDSHLFGAIPRESILAKVVWIYWPFTNFGKIDDFNGTP